MAARETGDLGRVAGRERHVFRGRGRGTSALDPKGGGFGPAPAGDWPAPPEGLVLDFGDAWAPGPPATSEGLWGAPGAASPSDSDEPGCLCLHYALAPSQPNCLAGCWWEGSWARVAHPPARLASRRAGELPGRVGDAATLGRTFAELGAVGLPASWAAPGAGRWPAGNVRATGEAGTRFPARPGPNVRAHGDVVAERPATVREADKLVAHGGRRACAGRPGAELVPGVRGWPCLCVDMQARSQGRHGPFARAGRRGPSAGEVHGRTGRMGALVPASTAGMAAPDAPGAHYARQRIERVFDVGRSHASLLPPRARSEEAPGGTCRPRSARRRCCAARGRGSPRGHRRCRRRWRPRATRSARHATTRQSPASPRRPRTSSIGRSAPSARWRFRSSVVRIRVGNYGLGSGITD